ncbi:26s proteasome regulatory subunit 7 [Quercus suber]|uniref:26s proteasome regulatory subunit 7 n=1 Tax=Quercus suber TaxID=58331 RepID=A0AAW0M7Y9_QUESU
MVEYGLSDVNGTEIRSMCSEAGMFAIRARRKAVTQRDFLDAVDKLGTSLLRWVSPYEAVKVYQTMFCYKFKLRLLESL